jgi:hypothetical protein
MDLESEFFSTSAASSEFSGALWQICAASRVPAVAVDAFLSPPVPHFEHGRAAAGRARQEAGPQRVGAERRKRPSPSPDCGTTMTDVNGACADEPWFKAVLMALTRSLPHARRVVQRRRRPQSVFLTGALMVGAKEGRGSGFGKVQILGRHFLTSFSSAQWGVHNRFPFDTGTKSRRVNQQSSSFAAG